MESKHTEWKETWRDDYLRWVCCFANALGGRLLLESNEKGQDRQLHACHGAHAVTGFNGLHIAGQTQ